MCIRDRILHRRMTATDTKIRSSHHHRHGELSNVVLHRLSDLRVVTIVDDHRYRRGGPGDVRRSPPDSAQFDELLAVGTDDQVPPLLVPRRRTAAALSLIHI